MKQDRFKREYRGFLMLTEGLYSLATKNKSFYISNNSAMDQNEIRVVFFKAVKFIVLTGRSV